MNSSDENDSFRNEDKESSAAPSMNIIFTCSKLTTELREECYEDIFSSDALKTYMKHIGYYKRKKRRRCLSMELSRILEPVKRDGF